MRDRVTTPFSASFLNQSGNLFNAKVYEDTRLSENGELIPAEGFDTTDFIAVEPDKRYTGRTFYNGYMYDLEDAYVGIYDGKRELICVYFGEVTSKKLAEYSFPENARFVRISEKKELIGCHFMFGEPNYMYSLWRYEYPEIYGENVRALSKNEIPLPFYYEAHVAEKNIKTNKVMDEKERCEAFIFLSDMHIYENTKASSPIIRSIYENTSVRFGINGGDTISSYIDERLVERDISTYNRYYGDLKLYYCRGNHDIWGKPHEESVTGFYPPKTMVYNRFIRKMEDMAGVVIDSGKTYYYFDRKASKTRFIITDNNEIGIETLDEKGSFCQSCGVSDEQLEWFAKTLSETPEDYAIVVVGHRPVKKELAWFNEEALIFGDIISAFNRREKISKVDRFGARVDADFTSAASKVILFLCGHGHSDRLYNGDDGCLYYEISCDSYLNNGGNPYERHTHTISESTLDVIVIDRDTNKIERIRYGANPECDGVIN